MELRMALAELVAQVAQAELAAQAELVDLVELEAPDTEVEEAVQYQDIMIR